MSRSQQLYDTWKNGGGDLSQYREEYHRDVTDHRGYISWHPSFVYRFTRSPASLNRDKSDVGENFKPPRETEEYSHLLFKHKGTDTWLHVKSGTHIVVGEPVGFKAYVTINGQSLTVGEYYVDTDPDAVFEWAREWMENHPDGYDSE